MPVIPDPPVEEDVSSSDSTQALPIRKHRFAAPKLRLQLNDLGHEGSSIFLSNIKGSEDLDTQVQNVLNLLYTAGSIRPHTRSVTFIVRDMGGGVAYTTGSDLDNDHKEIHVHLGYISAPREDQRHEILGVLCHELVHCFQWSCEGSPGGLIEGIADWVRLNAGLAAKHWQREAGGNWDAGYQHTGYFLEYLERRFGNGTVRTINAGLRAGSYDEEKVFGKACQGAKVGDLWEDYKKDLAQETAKGD